MSVFALPSVMGHRGAAAYAPENTLPSFEEAKRLGVNWVEFDVKLSAEGIPIIFHDQTLDRTTNGHGAVSKSSLADLRQLDAGHWMGERFMGTSIPTLEETLHLLLARGLSPNIELKPCPGRESETAVATLDLLAKLWPAANPVLLSSFSEPALAAALQHSPHIPRGLLIWQRPDDWLRRLIQLRCLTLHVAHQSLTPEWVERIKGEGYGLAVYTVNEARRAAALYHWGVDCVISDAPDRILPLKRRGKSFADR